MILADLSKQQLNNYLSEKGEKPFRANQIIRNVYNGTPISEMSDLSKSLREKLLQDFENEPVKILKYFKSKDGSIKFLFSLYDGNVIEGVLMKYKYGYTQCVSTQVGCRMGCVFCASTINGLVRNLSSGEILSQICVVNRFLNGSVSDRKITNVVLMGMGEPFDNYDNVIDFLRKLIDEQGLNISSRNISLSTCGLVDKTLRFAEEKIPLNLTISLHSPFDSERKKIMPVANKYSISEILKACDNYFEKTGRRYIFEYSLIQGKNDREEDAKELIRILKGRPCHVNLIRLNEVKEKGLKGDGEKQARDFCQTLIDGGLSATVRRIIGADIEGACGQLRAKTLKENKC